MNTISCVFFMCFCTFFFSCNKPLESVPTQPNSTQPPTLVQAKCSTWARFRPAFWTTWKKKVANHHKNRSTSGAFCGTFRVSRTLPVVFTFHQVGHFREYSGKIPVKNIVRAVFWVRWGQSRLGLLGVELGPHPPYLDPTRKYLLARKTNSPTSGKSYQTIGL